MLAFEEQGDPDGVPVLFFHGLPGSRLTRHPNAAIAERLGIRLFTFDRPGIGCSSPKRGRRILDWPDDVAEFADAQGLDSFAVFGWSGGGPYALAVAHSLPGRVRRVGLVASVTPLAGTDFVRHLSRQLRRRARVGRLAPALVRLAIAREVRAFTRDPARALSRAFADSPECDRAVAERFRDAFIEWRREAYRQGVRGVADDALLYLKSWGFDPADVRVPVRLWHGEQDPTLTIPLGRHLAQALPHCNATFVPGEGHLLCLARWKEILQEVAAP
jgi:pimeloyl-ACP methyl ester carboxylesterase